MDPNNPYENQQQQQQQFNPYAQRPGFGMQLPSVPNAMAIMVLGICSIVFCGLGPILGTISLILAKQAKVEFESKPGVYDPNSFSNVKTGRICGIIGVCVGILAWMFIAVYLIFVWWVMKQATDAIQDIQMQQY